MEGEVGFEPTVRVRDGVTARRPFLQNVSPMVRSARLERALSSNSVLNAARLPIPPRSHGRRRAIRTLTSVRRPGLSRLGLPNSPSHRYLEPAARFELAEIWLLRQTLVPTSPTGMVRDRRFELRIPSGKNRDYSRRQFVARLVWAVRLELTISCFRRTQDAQLPYAHVMNIWIARESNSTQRHCKCCSPALVHGNPKWNPRADSNRRWTAS